MEIRHANHNLGPKTRVKGGREVFETIGEGITYLLKYPGKIGNLDIFCLEGKEIRGYRLTTQNVVQSGNEISLKLVRLSLEEEVSWPGY